MATSSTRPVVVGIDEFAADSAAGYAAARLAAAEAVLHRRPLRLLSPDPAPAAREIRDGHPALPVECETTFGDLADALVDRSRTAHLIVVAAHQDNITSPHSISSPRPVTSPQPFASSQPLASSQPFASSPADPFGAQVAAHSDCPVIIEPAGSAGMVGPVLLGTNDEAEEPAVTEYAYVEALVRGVELHVVHVWAEPPDGALSTVDPFAYDDEAAAEDADRLLAEALAGWASKYPDVRVERQAMHDPNVAHALLRLSVDAALMVVGARHHAGLSGQLVGSVTGSLIGRTHCPLAVVPARCTWPVTD